MAQTKFDPEDIGMLVLGILASGVMVGIVTVSAFGYSLDNTLFSVAGGEVSLAYLISLGTFAGILITNNNEDIIAADGYEKLQNSGMADYYVYVVLASAAVLVGWVILPDTVATFFNSADIWGVVYMGGMAASQVALGWMY